MVEITKYPEGRRSAEGRVTEILGHKNDPGVDIISIIRKFGLPEAFPEEVMQEAERTPQAISPEELKERRDFVNKPSSPLMGRMPKIWTMLFPSPEMSKAIMCLGVHIADISYYVPEGSPYG